jgi:hypothetical protein
VGQNSIKTVRAKKKKRQLWKREEQWPLSTTDTASVALLLIAAENNILNDFQFLGCFS